MLPEIEAGAVTTAVRLQRLGYRAAYRALQLNWFARRPHTRGVKTVIRHGDHVLLIRHSYGARDQWELPGGGRHRGEDAPTAARREVLEELGVDIEQWIELGAFDYRRHATAHLIVLMAELTQGPIRPALRELEEVRWAPISAPPQPLGSQAALSLAKLREAEG